MLLINAVFGAAATARAVGPAQVRTAAGNADFRILTFEFCYAEGPSSKKVFIDLTPASKVTVNEVNRLAQEGLDVRGMFRSAKGKVGVIVERLK